MNYQLWSNTPKGLINVTSLIGNVTWGSSIEELGQHLEFDVAFSDTKLFPKNPLDLGQVLFLRNGNDEIIRGLLVDETKNGRQPIHYTCLDGAFRLNNSKAVYQFNIATDRALRKIFTDINLSIGNIVSIPTRIKKIYVNKSLAEIIKDILEQAQLDQGVKYRMEMRAGKVFIERQTNLLIKATFKLASNLSLNDGQFSISNPSRNRSIMDMKNSVQIVQENKVIQTTKNQKLIDDYGLLQDVVEVQEKDIAQARNIAKNILKDFGRIIETNSLEMIGDYRVRAGRTLEINEPVTGMKGIYLIKSVEHTLKGGIHLMSLELGGYNE